MGVKLIWGHCENVNMNVFFFFFFLIVWKLKADHEDVKAHIQRWANLKSGMGGRGLSGTLLNLGEELKAMILRFGIL